MLYIYIYAYAIWHWIRSNANPTPPLSKILNLQSWQDFEFERCWIGHMAWLDKIQQQARLWQPQLS